MASKACSRWLIGILALVVTSGPASTGPLEQMEKTCSGLRVDYQIAAVDPQIIYQPAADIRRKSGLGMDVLGLYQRAVGVGVDVSDCNLQVIVELQSAISIANEAWANPCVEKGVVAHERTHFSIQKRAFETAARKSSLQDIAATCIRTAGCSAQRLQQIVQNEVYVDMEQEARAGHAALDSEESVSKTQNACPKAFSTLGKMGSAS